MAHKMTVLLSDSHIDAVYDFIRDDAIVPASLGDPLHVKGLEPPILLRDRQVKGLQLRVGKRRLAWQFEHERSDHGKRVYTCKALGYFDRGFNLSGRVERAAWHVTTDAAREAATVIAGKLLEGTAPAHRRAGARFAEAFEELLPVSGTQSHGERQARPLGPQCAASRQNDLAAQMGHLDPRRNE
jgi:hypothetical protein